MEIRFHLLSSADKQAGKLTGSGEKLISLEE